MSAFARRSGELRRRGWDSNPRYPCGHDSFQDCYLQPLGHLSSIGIENEAFGESPVISILTGGERGIRTPDTGKYQYNGLANRRLQPLGHLSRIGVAIPAYDNRGVTRTCVFVPSAISPELILTPSFTTSGKITLETEEYSCFSAANFL